MFYWLTELRATHLARQPLTNALLTNTLLTVLLTTAIPTAGLLAQTIPSRQPAAAPTDTLTGQPAPNPAGPRRPWYRGALLRGSLVPVALITYGASTINGRGIYSSYQAKKAVRETFGAFRTPLDHLLPAVPYLGLGALLLAGVEARHTPRNLGMLLVESEALMLSSVYLTKHLTRVQRPDSSTHRSFPSGHTAQAFLGASIIDREFRHKSHWYGIGAYALATGVGALRMVNNKHWQADVIAGAGFGIWSAHLGYLAQRPAAARRRRPPVNPGAWQFSPAWSPTGAVGLRLDWHPQ